MSRKSNISSRISLKGKKINEATPPKKKERVISLYKDLNEDLYKQETLLSLLVKNNINVNVTESEFHRIPFKTKLLPKELRIIEKEETTIKELDEKKPGILTKDDINLIRDIIQSKSHPLSTKESKYEDDEISSLSERYDVSEFEGKNFNDWFWQHPNFKYYKNAREMKSEYYRNDQVVTGGPTCPRCKGTNTLQALAIVASGDEGFGSNYSCNDCKLSWRRGK